MSLLETETATARRLLAERAARPLAWQGEEPVAKNVGAGLILASEACAELGAPGTPSASVLVYTSDEAPAGDAAWIVGGDELGSAGAQASSFAQVVIVKGAAFDAEAYHQCAARLQRLADHPGWQVKLNKGEVWVRASERTCRPSLARAASTLISRIRSGFPAAQGVEVWFAVNDEPLVRALHELAVDVAERARGSKEGVWKERGFDYKSCQLSGHCGACSDKKTCASVRQIEQKVRIQRRKNIRIDDGAEAAGQDNQQETTP